MMRITLDINGREIGSIGVWNTQDKRVVTGDEPLSWVELRYQVHDLRGFDGDNITNAPLITEIWHKRSDGAAALTARVMEEVPDSRLDG